MATVECIDCHCVLLPGESVRCEDCARDFDRAEDGPSEADQDRDGECFRGGEAAAYEAEQQAARRGLK